nr:hypothetical protein [Tanacetum cinerariifolium]
PKSSEDEVVDDAGKKSIEFPRKKNGVQDPAKEGDKNNQEKDLRDQEDALRKQYKQEFERLFGQGEAANTNRLNAHQLILMFTHVSVAGSTYVNLGGSIPVNDATLPNVDLCIDPLMPDLEDTVDL